MDWLIATIGIAGSFVLAAVCALLLLVLTKTAQKKGAGIGVAIFVIIGMVIAVPCGGWAAMNARDVDEVPAGCIYDRMDDQTQTIELADALAGTVITSNSYLYVWDNADKFTLDEWHEDEYANGDDIDAKAYYEQLTTDGTTGKATFEYDACEIAWLVYSEGQNKGYASPPTYFDAIESRITKGRDLAESAVDDLKKLKIYKVGAGTNVSETTTLDVSEALTEINPILAFKNATNNASLTAEGYITRIRIDKSTFASSNTGVAWADFEFGDDWDELTADDDEISDAGDMIYVITSDWYKKNNTLYGGVNGIESASFAIQNLTYGATATTIATAETIAFSYYLEIIDGDGNCIYQFAIATMTITAVD